MRFPVVETRIPCLNARNREESQSTAGQPKGTAMKVTILASTCDKNDCPTIYETDRDTILVQGETPTDHGLAIPEHETLVEIPLDLIRKAFSDRFGD